MAICLVPGCPVIVDKGRCPAHARPVRQHERRYYSGISGLNYGRRWRRLRPLAWSRHPYCADCGVLLQLRDAEIDHVVPHRGDPELFWDETNLTARCKPCHSRKTAIELNAACATDAIGGGDPKSSDVRLESAARTDFPVYKSGDRR